MRGIYKRAGVALVASALVLGLAGCASAGPASDPAKGDNALLAYTAANTADAQTFDKVTFGNYQGEPISWLKLAEQDGKTLLISEYVLDAVPYGDGDVGYAWSTISPRPTADMEWADSSLRAWLNGEFAQAAFNADERGSLVETALEDTKNNVTPTGATGADASVHVAEGTTDTVFLLSVTEAKQYFTNNGARAAMPTAHAIAQGVYTGVAADDSQADGAAIWWLRTPGYYGGYASVVTDDGYVHGAGYRINGELHDGFDDHGAEKSELGGNVGVRPAVWVETSALS